MCAKVAKLITVGEAVVQYESLFQELRQIVDLDDSCSPEFRGEVHRLIDQHMLLAKEGILQLLDKRRAKRR
jgi:hypothetical protein